MNHVITLLSLHKKQRKEIMEKEKLVVSLETCEERIQRKKSDFKKGVRKKYNMTLKDLSNKEIDEIMKEAPVIIFITDPLASPMDQPLAIDERVSEICNAQSMGAAIENMTLPATELGLGSLWICNTFFAQEELNHWLNADGQLYAALAVGYADEAPAPRPRRKAELTVEWRK